MTTSIRIKKTIMEEIELPKLPFYSHRYSNMFYMIAEDQRIIYVSNNHISLWEPHASYYGDTITDALRGEECKKEVFDDAFSKSILQILSVVNPPQGNAALHTMHTLDPKEGQEQTQEGAQEQANETQQQATDEKAAEEKKGDSDLVD